MTEVRRRPVAGETATGPTTFKGFVKTPNRSAAHGLRCATPVRLGPVGAQELCKSILLLRVKST